MTTKLTSDNANGANEPKLFAFEETPAAEVDVSLMGGGSIPFYGAENLVNLPIVIHNVEFHELVHSKFGDAPKWYVYFTFYKSSNTQMYVCSFGLKSPVAGQLQAFEDAAVPIETRLPMGPVTIVRQAKSYRLASPVAQEGF